tara:strand:+ start:925 stop:1128 length:204 start_codon:yes stop_codon:yes gene_type:complete
VVQGKMGRRIKKGQGRETPTMRKEQSEVRWKGLSKVQTISESLKQNTQDIWKHVKWTKASSDKKKEK